MFEISFGDVFAGGGFDTLDTGVVVDLEDVALAVGRDENVDASNGQADAMEGFFGESLGFFVRFDDFDGAAEREVGAEVALAREAAHGINVLADDEYPKVFFVGDKLLD